MKLVIEQKPLVTAKVGGGGKKGSKYLNDDIREAAEQLEVGVNSFVVPTIDGLKPKKMQLQTRWLLNNEAKAAFAAIENPAEGAVPKQFSAKVELNAEGQEIGIRIGRKA